MEKLQALLGGRPGETTPDRRFTLETVYCVGSCSMAPVGRIDGDTYGRLRADRLPKTLQKYGAAVPAGEEEHGL